MNDKRLAELLPLINEVIKEHGEIFLAIRDTYYDFILNKVENGLFDGFNSLIKLYFCHGFNDPITFEIGVSSTSMKDLNGIIKRYVEPMAEAGRILKELEKIDTLLVNPKYPS